MTIVIYNLSPISMFPSTSRTQNPAWELSWLFVSPFLSCVVGDSNSDFPENCQYMKRNVYWKITYFHILSSPTWWSQMVAYPKFPIHKTKYTVYLSILLQFHCLIPLSSQSFLQPYMIYSRCLSTVTLFHSPRILTIVTMIILNS